MKLTITPLNPHTPSWTEDVRRLIVGIEEAHINGEQPSPDGSSPASMIISVTSDARSEVEAVLEGAYRVALIPQGDKES